ncbi:transferase [Aquabacterium sp.]|uniref:spermine/spermidine synthase domain-containing protein n=1 Tax=Aquabacterium sp. TaxID=1872578 RepID=UPI003784FA46
MPETTDPAQHVKPFVHESLTRKTLQFSLCEIQSRMDVRDPHALDLEYTRTMMGFLLFLPQPRHLSMIGLGGGSLAKFCHRHLPDTRLHVIEINPHVIALRDEFHVPPDSERFRVIAGDGAHYVRYRSARCDVLMVDGFDYNGQPGSLCSQRFYDDCHELLQPGGMLVVNLHFGHPDHLRHVERIRRSFSGAVLVVDDEECSNSIVFACKGPGIARLAAGTAGLPKGLSRDGARQLMSAFSLVTSAWQAQYG